MLKCRVATDAADALTVRRYLFRQYAQVLNWVPKHDNPSKWIVKEQESPQPYFSDFYDDKSTWFYACAPGSEDIVSCCRLIVPKEKKLELELYHKLPAEFAATPQRLELNRMAFSASAPGTHPFLDLFLFVLEHCLAQDIKYLLLPAPANMAGMLLSLGFKNAGVGTFKYADTDPFPVSPLYLNFHDKPSIEGLHRKCRNLA